jgi:hypothetical protein
MQTKKNKNMKQLLPLFLFLLPCLALAQYPSNGNQKITLGEQTTADGLIYRGVAADTTLTAKSDTAAYFVLDTVNINLYTYKASATGRKWRQLGADTASIAYVNTYGTQTVNGAKTFTSAVTATRFNPTATTVTGNGMYLPAANTLGFSTNGAIKLLINSHGSLSTNVSSLMTTPWKSFEIGTGVGTMVLAGRTDGLNNLILGTNWTYDGGDAQEFLGSAYSSQYFQQDGNHIIRSSSISGSAGADITYNEIARFTKEGNVGIGTASPQSGYRLHVVDSVYVGGRVSAAGYTTRSDYNLKDEIKNINYGLNEIMQITPVSYTYKSNGEHQLGFIAQDIGVIIPESVHFDELMGVDYQSIIPILTKAIQEQNLLIKALEQRIINLENK